MPIFPVLKKGADGTFGPTSTGHYYKRIYYHGRKYHGRTNKSTWCIKEYEEYGVFKLADEEGWHCATTKGLFSILDKGTYIVGNKDEVLSFFPSPPNLSDTWHGFPVKSEDKMPSYDLLEIWVKKGIINHSTRMRIERGQL